MEIKWLIKWEMTHGIKALKGDYFKVMTINALNALEVKDSGTINALMHYTLYKILSALSFLL